MARPGITQEQVFATADQLREDGVQPTVQAIRERLGSGSFSTITSHLAAWREQHAAQAIAEIPPIPDRVQSAFEQAWAAATRAAQETMEKEREALDAVRQQMEREKSEMAGEIERLEGMVETSDQRIEALEQELAQAKASAQQAQERQQATEQQITDLRIENARLDERAKGSEEHAGKLADLVKSLEDKLTPKAPAKRTAKAKAPNSDKE